MSDIQFEADFENNPHRPARAASNPAGMPQFGQPQASSHIGMVNWLIKHGIISGESSAKAVLIGLISINFIATAAILYFFVFR